MIKKARIYIFICFVALIQYSNTFEHDYAWDDVIVITENDRVKEGLSHPAAFFRNIKGDEVQYRYGYRPITLLTFALDVELSGMTPKTGHVMSVLYFALLCCLIFYFLRRMFPEKGTLFSVLIVGLFLIHPVHVEVVANIKSRDEILTMIFGLTSMIFFLNFLESGKNKILNACLVLLTLTLSFLSKENGITFVGILLLVGLFKNSEQMKPYVKYGLPVLGGILLLGIRFFVYSDSFFENNATELLESFQYKEDGFLGNPLHDATGLIQILPNVFNILIKNVGLMLFPITLVHDYGFSHSTIVGWSDPLVIVSLIFHLGLIYVVIREFKKKTILLFGILFYFITLSVFLNIIQVGPDYMAERFLFIPSLGFIIAMVVLLERITQVSFKQGEKFWKSNKTKAALGVVLLFFILGFVKTSDRNKAWENNTVLFETDIDALDDCARTQYNYACLLHSQYYQQPTELKQEKILYHYGRAVEITNRSMKAMLDLGNAYMEFGQTEQGKLTFLKAVDAHEGLVAPLLQLGNYYFSQNQFKEAMVQYKKAEELAKLPNIYHSKAICFLKLNQVENAISALKEGEKYNPTTSDYFVLMSDLYVGVEDKLKAIEAIQKAIDLAPEDKALRDKLNLLNKE